MCVHMARFLRAIFLATRLMSPWIARATAFTINLMAVAVASLWVGVPRATDNIATEWVQRAVAGGMPTVYDIYLYRIVRIVALLVILVGWILFSFITVFVVLLLL